MTSDWEAALAAVEEVVARGGEADDVLRAVLAALHERGISYAAIRFVERGELIQGPMVGAGDANVSARVVYDGAEIGELELAGGDQVLVDTVAARIAPYVLVGWDTSGEPWDA